MVDNAEMVDNEELDGWRRLGEKVRKARTERGYSNRESFAEVCRVSVRVVSDMESGLRANFTGRVIARIEEGLDWPSGTMDQIVSNPDFTPPGRETGGDLLFRPPVFERRPVPVEVSTVERAIAIMTEMSKAKTSGEPPPPASGLTAATVALCWPYVLRLVEDNCLPGNELHPAVRPLYDTFMGLARQYAPVGPARRYAQWLVGEGGDITEAARKRYMNRWQESRRLSRGPSREGDDADD